MLDWVEEKIRARPIVSSLILAIVGVIFAFGLSALVKDKNLRRMLWTAGVTLFFGAFLGGSIKILFDDFQRKKEQRAEQARDEFERKRVQRAAKATFLSNILDDLKTVYDRVERARILVPAHKSAKTYGNEMRDLIEARVQLLNVERALKRGQSRIEDPEKQRLLESYVESMHEYLKKLTDEFKEQYRPIALLQSRFESERDKWLENQVSGNGNEKPGSSEDNDCPPNLAWQELYCLPALQDFMGLSSDDAGCGSEQEDMGSETQGPDYEQEFLVPLNEATKLLRNELVSI